MYKRKKPHYKFASVQIELELQQQCQNKVPACVSFFHLCNFTINSLEMRFMSPIKAEMKKIRKEQIELKTKNGENEMQQKPNQTTQNIPSYILFCLIWFDENVLVFGGFSFCTIFSIILLQSKSHSATHRPNKNNNNLNYFLVVCLIADNSSFGATTLQTSAT